MLHYGEDTNRLCWSSNTCTWVYRPKQCFTTQYVKSASGIMVGNIPDSGQVQFLVPRRLLSREASPLATLFLQACPNQCDSSAVINAEAEKRPTLGSKMYSIISSQDGEGGCSVLDDCASEAHMGRVDCPCNLQIAAMKVCCQNASLPVFA